MGGAVGRILLALTAARAQDFLAGYARAILLRPINPFFALLRDNLRTRIEKEELYSNTSRLSISILKTAPAGAPVVLFFHGGDFTDGDRFDIPSYMFSYALQQQVWFATVGYGGLYTYDTLETLVSNAHDALRFAARSFPGSKIIVHAVSAGSLVAYNALLRAGAPAVAAFVADSPITCLAAFEADSENDDRLCWDRPFGTMPKLGDAGALRCMDDFAIGAPALVVYAHNDHVIPEKSAARFKREAPAVEVCEDPYGIHGFASTALGGCLRVYASFMDGVLDSGSSLLATALDNALAEAVFVATTMTLIPLLGADILCTGCIGHFRDVHNQRGYGYCD